jgi:hypothetical protein
MDLLAGIREMLNEWSVTHNADTRQIVNNRVQTYLDVYGENLPADVQASVDAMNGVGGAPGGGFLPVTLAAPKAGTDTRPVVSAAGLRIANVLIPWAGVGALVLFGVVAWTVAKKRRR